MTNDILKLLEEANKVEDHGFNSRVLIIDGLNLYLRNFSVHGALNDHGVPVGGLVGFLKSLSYSIRTLNPTRIIVVYDGVGGSKRRRSIYPEYKNKRKPTNRITKFEAFANAEEEKESMRIQFSRLLQYLDLLPVSVLSIDYVEADDVIAYIATSVLKESKITILSSDRDFLQLVDDRITVWNSNKKVFYTPSKVKEEYGIPSHNFLLYKALIGDSSDNIKSIKGLGPKKPMKIFPEIQGEEKLTLEHIFNQSKENKGLIFERILENKDNLERDLALMNLLDNENIGLKEKLNIKRLIEEAPNDLNEVMFLDCYKKDFLGSNLGNPSAWLRDYFVKLQQYKNLVNG